MVRLVSLLFIAAIIFSCKTENQEPNSPATESSYDEALAKKYKADDYGMKKYVVAFLKSGPNRDRSKEEAAALQKAHMDNIGKMAEEGKLILAGPFMGGGDLRGIYVFDVETIAEAETLTNTDPAIKAGSLVMELHEWYGSAAVMAIPELHEKVTKVEM